MSEAFDAHYVWLGIGPEERPANHYRLLGIRLFEPNPEVIESAADRQMAHLRTFQQGKNAALSQRLLNEVSAARVCLLNPATKATYDAQLRAAAGPATRLPRPAPNLPTASPLGASGGPGPAQTTTNWDALIGTDAGPSTSRTSKRRVSKSIPRKQNNQLVYIVSAAVVLVAVGVGIVIYLNGTEGEPAPQDAQAAKPGEPQPATPAKTSTVASNQGPPQPVAPLHVVNVTIDWPVTDLEDGRLTIDGKEQPLNAIKLEFPLTQGRHTIQLTRDGFEPIRQTLDIGSQPLPVLTPRWVRKAAVASADDPMSPVTPTPAIGGDDAAATHPMKQKLPVPSAAEQAQIAKQLDETYKVENVAEKDHALAVQLFDTADGPGNSPAERYTLLTKAAGIAADAGDFELAFRRGIDPLEATYEIDPFEMKQKLLEDAAKSARAANQIVAIVVTAEQLIGESLADERYDTALEIAAMAKKVAENPRAEPRFRGEATERLARRVREINVLEKASAVAIEAEATLEKSPDDAAANLTLGRWYCLYKRDWDRGLPLLAKGPDGPFKKLAQQELAVDLTLKPQLDLADGWWEVGQKESGIPKDSARLHAGAIYRLQFPNVQPGLKKTAIDQRLKEIDAIAGQTAPTSLADRSDDNLPRTHWDRFDLGNAKLKRKIAHLTKGANEMVTKDVFTGPIEIEIKARTEQNNIRIYGPRGSSVIFNWEKNPRELRVTRPDGDDRAESGSLATAPVEPLAPNQWHLIRWRMTETGMQVSADGKIVFSEQRGYDLTTPGKVAVRTIDSNVDINHFVVSRAKSPSGATEPKSKPEGGTSAAEGFPRNRWVDVLSLVDTAKHAVKGTWSRNGSEVSYEPNGEDCIKGEVPVVVRGSYDLELEFTRTDGDSDVVPIFSVGGRQCSLLLSMDHGALSGIDRVDGKRPWDEGNPTVVRPGALANGRAYRLLISVRQARPEHASIDVYLDGKPYLPHWEGDPASLSLYGAWSLPDSRELGLAGWNTHATFHAMRLKVLAGQATKLASTDGVDVKSAPDSTSGASGQFARNRWIDVLKLVDTQTDAVRGLWSRDGDEVSCQPEDFSRVKLPVILSGGYDLEVEFTRTGGKSDVCLALPVGPTECTVLLSASNGDYSGLEYVDGVDIHNPKNPVVVRPGALENGRRYRLLASVRHFKDGTFSIDIMLDGKPYLPHWQGKPSSLKIYSGWMLPNAGEPGVGALKSATTFHSARLRVVSGEAIPEAEYQKPSVGPKIVKARWGGGNNWADVSVQVRRAVDDGKTVFAKRDFLGADPTPGWRKHLEITYEKDGEQKKVSIDEDRQWTPQDYAGQGTP